MAMGSGLFNALFNPAALLGLSALEEAQKQAKAAGVESTFEILWRAEQYRARSMPGVCLSPKEILHIAVATAEYGA